MEDIIEIIEILDKIGQEYGYEDWEDFSECAWFDRHKNTLGEAFTKALKQAYNKGVTDSAESAEIKVKSPMDCFTEIDKQSILKNLIP